MSDQIQIQFDSIQFAAPKNGILAQAKCSLKGLGENVSFGFDLAPTVDAKWKIMKIYANENIRDFLLRNRCWQPIENEAAKLLMQTNLWRRENVSEIGSKVEVNQQLVQPEEAGNLVFSFRGSMLSLPTSKWVDLWALIKSRVEGDPFFHVRGFSKDEIRSAINQLIPLFPENWVHARYRSACRLGNIPSMAADLPQESNGWFPAYHLARTALGAICIDPGWNYLIEIGLSIQELAGFHKLAKLKDQITRSPETQHQLCLAAELYRRGHLLSLEPSTGSGSSTNDLLTKIGEREYAIEVKEFASKQPDIRLLKELEEKAQRLPSLPKRPVVFYAVLLESGISDRSREDGFFDAVQKLRNNIPEKISAIVAGRRFVDSSGGRVKRDAEYRILNPKALKRSCDKDLSTLFARNYDSIKSPTFGIGNFILFSITPTSSESV